MGEEESKESKDNKYAGYSIYYYFKEHPAILLTLISLIAAGCASLIKLASYIEQALLCQYWEIDKSFIRNDNTNFLYYFGFTLIYIIIYNLLTDVIQTITDRVYLDKTRLDLYNFLNKRHINVNFPLYGLKGLK